MNHQPSTILPSLLTGKVCLVGVGNRMKGDDAAGPSLIDEIKGKVNAACFDAGVAPENYLEKIVRMAPDIVVIVDAMDFKGRPGEIRVFAPGDLAAPGISTHALSLEMVCEYLASRLTARTILVGIQATKTVLGAGMAAEVTKSVHSLARMLMKSLPL